LSIDVIIPSRNEEKCIKQCIESLLSQSSLPNRIIVVLDRCTDRTEEIVDLMILQHSIIKKIKKNFTKHPKTFMKGFLIAESINEGLKNNLPLSDFVMIANADSVFSENYIKEALVMFQEQKCGLVGYADNYNISGSGYIIRNEILSKLGNSIQECASEDTYLQFFTMDIGYNIKKLKDSSIDFLRDRGDPSFDGKLKYHFMKGYSAYTLGFSFLYETGKIGYWILKGRFFSIMIIVGFIYAYLKKVEKLDIATSDVIKEWQKGRMNSILHKF
jgi:glycosyltransferase involved in cell wall biosynthesis